MRVNQIYDIDNKTYLIRLNRTEEKSVLCLESGNRIHTTAFEWPKNVAPSGFTMKLRKHLKNKRLEKLEQLGVDRVIKLQFGIDECAFHVILELYDRGNIILTDHEMTIMNILRPHTEGEEIRLVVREKYCMNRAKADTGAPDMNLLKEYLKTAKPGDQLRRVLNSHLEYGPSLIEHVLYEHNLIDYKIPGEEKPAADGKKSKNVKEDKSHPFDVEVDFSKLEIAVNDAEKIMRDAMKQTSKGFIIQRRDLKPSQTGGEDEFYDSNLEYHPMLFAQHRNRPYKEFDSFNISVDEFYSTLEGQKIDLKAMHQEREAIKKLTNVKKDHAKRLTDLTKTQLFDIKKAELITRNQQLVDNAILAIRSALANQMSWPDIQELVKAAQNNGDMVAKCIKQLKLEINHISLFLTDPYQNDVDEDDDDEEKSDSEEKEEKLESMVLDVDLGLSAYANARRFHDQRRNAAKKELKTIESSQKAMKSAERKTKQALKDVKNMTSIAKARKTFWFEKFYWFISSENFLIIGGRDQQQNELIVKRYMRSNDVYVHADIQGASSVVIRNPTENDIPIKTLLEAGAMAVSYSVAWDAKVVTSAYWVKSDQVTKTAPTGEYLGTGSFMIRGKKNFLPACHLILGLSFLFKLEESSVERHKGERRIRKFDDEDSNSNKMAQLMIENEKLDMVPEEEDEIVVEESDGDDSDESDGEVKFPDSHVKIEHDTGKVTVKSDPKIEKLQSEFEDKEKVIFLGDDKPYIIQPLPPRLKQLKGKQLAARIASLKQEQEQKEIVEEKEDDSNKKPQAKRGQKAKLKKIKEKYKDQDEDERMLRMDILKSAGTSKDSRKGKKEAEAQKIKKIPVQKHFEPKPQALDGEEIDENPASADVDMLDSLTGIPHDDDELLFAVPVVAPYQALHNYK